MTCEACSRAEAHPMTGVYQSGCDGCAARALASSPGFAESARTGKQSPRYRMALAQFFAGREAEGHTQVKRWADRLAAHRETT